MKDIIPIAFFGKTYNRIEIGNPVVTLNERAKWTAKLFTEDGDPAQAIVREVEISGEEYNSWSNDDNYIIETTCEKMGLQLA